MSLEASIEEAPRRLKYTALVLHLTAVEFERHKRQTSLQGQARRRLQAIACLELTNANWIALKPEIGQLQ